VFYGKVQHDAALHCILRHNDVSRGAQDADRVKKANWEASTVSWADGFRTRRVACAQRQTQRIDGLDWASGDPRIYKQIPGRAHAVAVKAVDAEYA